MGPLEAIEGEADGLLKHAVFFEQCVILYEGQNHATRCAQIFPFPIHVQTRNRKVVNYEVVANRAIDLIDSTSPVVSRWRENDSEYFQREPTSLERRTTFLMTFLLRTRVVQQSPRRRNPALTATIEEWEEGRGSLRDGLELLSQAMSTERSDSSESPRESGASPFGIYYKTATAERGL